jgi:hypothetical protein
MVASLGLEARLYDCNMIHASSFGQAKVEPSAHEPL